MRLLHLLNSKHGGSRREHCWPIVTGMAPVNNAFKVQSTTCKRCMVYMSILVVELISNNSKSFQDM